MRFHGRIALLAIGALALVLPASASAETATKHHLDMYKVEQHVTLPEYQTSSYSLSCPNGDIAADGMWRIDEVGPFNEQLADDDEDPWTLATGVSVRAAYPDEHDVSAYHFSFRNNVSATAQLKLFVTCLGKKTAPDTFRHKMVVYDRDDRPAAHGGHDDYPNGLVEEAAWNGANDNVKYKAQGCKGGSIFISPGFKINHGEADIFASFPSTNNLRQWTYGFYVKSNVNITVYGRCLSLKTATNDGHKHSIYAYRVTSPVDHFDKGSSTYEHQISCGEHQKGLVGGFNVLAGDVWKWNTYNRHWLGMDPRIKARAFKTYGVPGGQYYLTCVNDRTSRPLFS